MDIEITKLSKKNHYEEITDQIKRLIVSGKLQVGDKLPSTKELSEQFGVGRSTTREALSALKAMGLIDIRQGGGSTVKSAVPSEFELPELASLRLNRKTILELLEARKSLEVSNASLAAKKRSELDISRMEGILYKMKLHIGEDLEGERCDLQFHQTLAAATGNSILVRVFESISAQMEVAIRETRRVELYANRDVSERLYREHMDIFEAVRMQNPEQAELRMAGHLQHVESILMKYL